MELSHFDQEYFVAADEEHVRREKAKAKELRGSQWWKNLRGQGQCHYCKRRVKVDTLTMDHVVPIVRGGRTSKGNVVACCKECNSKKKHMLPIEWDEYMGRLAAKKED